MNLYFSNLRKIPFIDFIARQFALGEVPLLPTKSRQSRPLTIVVAIMCALGCLSALTARMGFRAADNWTMELKSAMTVLITAPRDEASILKAVEIAKTTQGVSSAGAMSRENAKNLLKNYGANIGVLLDELPLPSLIEIGLNGDFKDTKAKLNNALQSQGYHFEIDDHSRYSGEIVRTSAVLRGAALLALVALTIAAIASIGFAARAALETQSAVVEILHMVGAQDDFIAKEVQARFMRLGLTAGFYGAICAGLFTLAGIGIMQIGSSELTKGSELLKWYDAWVLILAPFITSLASALAARIAARETLRELV